MSVLLDTHACLWFIAGDTRLSPTARKAIEDPSETKFVGVASLWEMAIKVSLGKLQLTQPFESLIPRQLELNGFRILPIDTDSVARIVSLPFHHRDPFDRLLAAQCLTQNLTLVSGDVSFDAYGVRRVW